MPTRDTLNIVLALSSAVITVFLAWFLYYLIAIMKDLRETSRAVHDKVNQVGVILQTVKDHLSNSVSALTMLTNVISKIAGSWQQRRKAKRTRETPADGA